MNKIFLFVLLLPLLALAQQNKQCKKCKQPCSNCLPDTAKGAFTINNIMPAGSGNNASLDSALQTVLIKKLNEKESPWKFLEWLLPFVVSLFAMGISILSLVLSYKSLNRDLSYKHVSFLSEVDKLLVEHPYLRGIYDSQLPLFKAGSGMLTNCTQHEYNTKLYAYCYYLINNFETVFKHSEKGSTNRISWEKYMQHLIKNSTLFKSKVEDATTNPIFDTTYQEELKTLLANA